MIFVSYNAFLAQLLGVKKIVGPSPEGWFEGVLFRKKPVDSGTVFMPWHLMVWASFELAMYARMTLNLRHEQNLLSYCHLL